MTDAAGAERSTTRQRLLDAMGRGLDGRSTDIASGGGAPRWVAADAQLLLELRRRRSSAGVPEGGAPRAAVLPGVRASSPTSTRASS